MLESHACWVPLGSLGPSQGGRRSPRKHPGAGFSRLNQRPPALLSKAIPSWTGEPGRGIPSLQLSLCELPSLLPALSPLSPPTIIILCGCRVAKFQAFHREERMGMQEFQLTHSVLGLKFFSGPVFRFEGSLRTRGEIGRYHLHGVHVLRIGALDSTQN